MRDIKLNFINRSNDNTKDVVIYQPNIATMSYNEQPVAWKVFKNCGINEEHLFIFEWTVEVAIRNMFGEFDKFVEAPSGGVLEIVERNYNEQLLVSNRRTDNPSEFEVCNKLEYGSYGICCFRSDQLLAQRDDLYPSDTTYFRFPTGIHIGIVSDVEEGDEMEPEMAVTFETELNLIGITAADIVMTGGGRGEDATPIEFSLENIERKILRTVR